MYHICVISISDTVSVGATKTLVLNMDTAKKKGKRAQHE